MFNTNTEGDGHTFVVSLDDLGIHSGSGMALKITDAVTREDAGVISDGRLFYLKPQETKVYIGELSRA
ncbi:MAG: hypothetical protein IJH37_12925 [Clostridia bacterium]|nr:hypothetical protein [Clostridia bacterium]